MIFTRESLKHSIKPVIIIVLICLFVWIWGNHHKVDVALTMRPEILGSEQPSHIDMTIFEDGTENVAASFSQNIQSGSLPVQNLNLAPGNYFMRGIVSTQSGKTHIVTQTIVVPDDSASIEVFLREKGM